MENTEIEEKIRELENSPNTPESRRARGIEFEALILNYFSNEKILVSRSYHTSDNRSEQIDGAVKIGERIILLEIKWVKSTLAASELYGFIGKVDNKLFGTLGLFISKNKLSDNFIVSVQKGRQRKVIILHDEDIYNLFRIQGHFADFMYRAIETYSTDNILYYSVADYLTQEKSKRNIEKSEKSIVSDITKYISYIIVKDKVDDITIFNETEKLSIKQKRLALKYYLENIVDYFEQSMVPVPANYTISNIYTSIRYLKIFTDEEACNIYINKLIQDPKYPYILPFFWVSFLDLIRKEKSYHKKISNAIKIILYENFGNWDRENTITDCIIPFWKYIDNDNKKNILFKYFEIYLSSRRDRFSQKQFANKIVKEFSDAVTKDAVNEWISNKIKEDVKYLAKEDNETKTLDRASSILANRYKSFSRILEQNEVEFMDSVKSEYLSEAKKHFTDKFGI